MTVIFIVSLMLYINVYWFSVCINELPGLAVDAENLSSLSHAFLDFIAPAYMGPKPILPGLHFLIPHYSVYYYLIIFYSSHLYLPSIWATLKVISCQSKCDEVSCMSE